MGEWDTVHGALTEPQPYGDVTTYGLAAWWMHDGGCALVEDWGCGGGALSEWIHRDHSVRYRGIDGSDTPFAHEHADLREYRSVTEGIVVRHVLEHNYDWRVILDNAVASYTKRLAVVLFTPLVGETHVLNTEPEYGDRPVIAFALRDLLDAYGDVVPDIVTVTSPWSHFGSETLILSQRR